MRWNAAAGLAGMLAAVNDLLAQPFPLYYTTQTPRFLLLGTALYAVIAIVITSDHKNTRPGEEHGSARWGNVFALQRKYANKAGPNLLLTPHVAGGNSLAITADKIAAIALDNLKRYLAGDPVKNRLK